MKEIEIDIIDNEEISFNVDNSVVKVYPNLENLEIIPSKEKQTFKSENYYGYDEIKVNGVTSEIDGNIKAENIKEGVEVLGITGTYNNAKEEQEKTFIPNFSKGNVEVLPDESKVLNKVILEKDEDLQPYNIKQGVEIFGVEGTNSGVDINEYFLTNMNTQNKNQFKNTGFVLKVPKIEIDKNLKTLYEGFVNYSLPVSPEMDTSHIENMTRAFSSAKNLVQIQKYDLSSCTTISGIVSFCEKLTEFPIKDIPNVTDISNAFSGTGFTIPPELNTINVTNMTSVFASGKITVMAEYNMEKVTSASQMYNQCYNLIEPKDVYAPALTNASQMFYYCNKLPIAPSMFMPNVTNLSSIFSNCSKLHTIPEYDAGNVINISGAFNNDFALVNFGGLKDLGKAFLPTANENYSNYLVDFKSCNLLSLESAINILNKLYDIASKGCKKQKVRFHANTMTLLEGSEEGQQAIANAIAKGWNVTT